MSASSKSLSDILKSAPSSANAPWWRRPKWLAATLAVVLLGALVFKPSGKADAGRYITEEATIGKLVVTVSASGTLQPTKSVDVGSELSGTLESVLVNENDQVKKGQVLAQLDLSKLKDQVVKSRAVVAAADASVALAKATLAESRANLSRLRQVAALSGGQVPAKTELETAEAAVLRAEANEASAKASVTQARAALKTDETNVAKATIRSPVDGVVLTRKVEPGQTVVAAMTTPVLFNLAENLTQMELQIKVDEADVGSVKLGQPASFTVAAWPGRKFPATLLRVGMGSTITDNVVTYKSILRVVNDDLVLRPGMTASAEIVTARREQALRVPNAALRFTPPTPKAVDSGGFVANLLPKPPQGTQQSRAPQPGQPQVWLLGQDGQPKAVVLTIGVSDGHYSEVLGGDLKAGMAVITEYQEAKK